MPRGFHHYVYTSKDLSTEDIYSGFIAKNSIKDIDVYGITRD